MSSSTQQHHRSSFGGTGSCWPRRIMALAARASLSVAGAAVAHVKPIHSSASAPARVLLNVPPSHVNAVNEVGPGLKSRTAGTPIVMAPSGHATRRHAKRRLPRSYADRVRAHLLKHYGQYAPAASSASTAKLNSGRDLSGNPTASKARAVSVPSELDAVERERVGPRSSPMTAATPPPMPSQPIPLPPGLRSSFRALKAMRKARTRSSLSIGGINLASARAGAISNGLGLTPEPASRSKRHDGGPSSSTVTKPHVADAQPPAKHLSRIERAARNAVAVELATRIEPSAPHPEQSFPATSCTTSSTLIDRIWNSVSTLFSRARRRSQAESTASIKSAKLFGASAQQHASSALCVNSSMRPAPTASATITELKRAAEQVESHAQVREIVLNSQAPPLFELLPLHLPADYPPPTPRIPDMELRALALGVNHLAGTDTGPDSVWVLEKPGRLEYLGDAVLELATRTLLFREVEDLSPKTMAILKSHLVSNDILGHLYNQASLETLRLDTAEWALETLRAQHPKSMIAGGRKGIAREAGTRRAQAASNSNAAHPSSSGAALQARERRAALSLPELPHSRRADLFESYLGALYLSQPPSIASEWVQALLRPFAARAMRHELMGVDETLTRAGLIRRRIRARRQAEREKLAQLQRLTEEYRSPSRRPREPSSWWSWLSARRL